MARPAPSADSTPASSEGTDASSGGPAPRFRLTGEALGGIALIVATLAALIWANSPAGDTYTGFWGTYVTVGPEVFSVSEDLQHWVNDALMVIFFFVVGLEIKRELVVGELRNPRTAALPVVAALGGVVLPALIFVGFTAGTTGAGGWGIPMATDIAFAVGILALMASRVPAGAKLLLLTIAIVDDIIAIGVIAIFYSETISLGWLAGAVAGLAAVVAMRRLGVTAIWPYVPLGALVWLATLESGVHATIAGVALALLTPARPVGGGGTEQGREVLEILEHRLQPWSRYLVVPLFALANAGVVINADTLAAAASTAVTPGIAFGLLVGKTVGITLAVVLMVRTGWGRLPQGVGAGEVVGIAALAGIGFTVSLFIADLAFADEALVAASKIGIFAGSLTAAVLGAVILLVSARRNAARGEPAPAG